MDEQSFHDEQWRELQQEIQNFDQTKDRTGLDQILSKLTIIS